MTDHFEILEHNPDRILVRCGDSPLKTDVRESDGLFEVSARVNKDEGAAEFGLKSVFFQGLGKADKVPLPKLGRVGSPTVYEVGDGDGNTECYAIVIRYSALGSAMNAVDLG